MAATFTTTQVGSSADYIKYIYGGLQKKDRVNQPDLLNFSLHGFDGSFTKLVRGAYITITSDLYGVWFTGYIINEPEMEYLGAKNDAPIFGYSYEATGDEYVLNLKTIGIIPPFINTTQGVILKALIARLAPNAEFDVDGIQDGLMVTRYVVDPQKRFSDILKEFADSAYYRFESKNKVMTYAPQDDVECGISVDGSNKHFTPSRLKITASKEPIVNDVIILGDIEPQNYVNEYLVGDGATAQFLLVSSVYGVDRSVLVDEDFAGSSIDSAKWTLFDTINNYIIPFNGYLNVVGGDGSWDSYLQSANLIPLEGNIRITHGEWDFVDGSDGVIGGLWTQAPNDSLVGCVYGLRCTKSGTSTVIHPVVDGAVDSTLTVTVTPAKRYIIRTILVSPTVQRQTAQYAYMDSDGVTGVVGGDLSADTVVFETQITEIDPTTAAVTNQWVLRSTVSLSTSQTYANYVPVASSDLHCTVTGITISTPMQVSLEKCTRFIPGVAYVIGSYITPTVLNEHYYIVTVASDVAEDEPVWPTDSGETCTSGGVTFKESGTVPLFNKLLVGPNEMDSFDGRSPDATVIDGNAGTQTRSSLLGTSQYNPGQAQLTFFKDSARQSTSLPKIGDLLHLSYRRPGAAMARIQDIVNVQSEAVVWEDNGVRSVIKRDLVPLPRTSQECEAAAAAMVFDAGYKHYDGSYTMPSGEWFDTEPLAGSILKFENLPGDYPAALKAELVTQVVSRFLHVNGGECFDHEITFGKSSQLSKMLSLLKRTNDVFTPQDTAELPNYIDPASVGNSYALDVHSPVLVSWDANYIYFDTGVDAPAGGGFEVRYTDNSWGVDDGRNLIYRGSSRTFQVPRNTRGKVCFVKAQDGRNLLQYSEDLTEESAWPRRGSATIVNELVTNPDGGKSLVGCVTFDGALVSQPSGDDADVGNTYTGSCWVKGTKGETVYLYVFGANHDLSSPLDVTLTGGWQFVSFTRSLTVDDTGKVSIGFAAHSAAHDVYVTRVQLEESDKFTVYAKTRTTAYGAMSRFAAAIHIMFPMVPHEPTGMVTLTDKITVNLQLPAVMSDVWGIEIRRYDIVEFTEEVLYSQDLIAPNFSTDFVDTGITDLNTANYNVYTYNLLGEYSDAHFVSATISAPGPVTDFYGQLVNSTSVLLSWTEAEADESVDHYILAAMIGMNLSPTSSDMIGKVKASPGSENKVTFLYTPGVGTTGTGRVYYIRAVNRWGIPSEYWTQYPDDNSTLTTLAPDGSTDTGVPDAVYVNSAGAIPWPIGGIGSDIMRDSGSFSYGISENNLVKKWGGYPPVNIDGVIFIWIRVYYTGGDGVGQKTMRFPNNASIPAAGDSYWFPFEIPNATVTDVRHWLENYYGQGDYVTWHPTSGVFFGSKAQDVAPTGENFSPTVQAIGASRVEGRATSDLELDTYIAGTKIVVKKTINLDAVALQVSGTEVISSNGGIDNSKVTGLGDAATKNVGTGSGDVCVGNDSRLSDARAPLLRNISQSTCPTLDVGELVWWYSDEHELFPGQSGPLFYDGDNWWWISGPPLGVVTAKISPDGEFTWPVEGYPISDLAGFPDNSSVYLNGSGAFSTPAGSGGSSVLPYPDEPPASPHALDDEFNSSTLNAKWTGPAGVVTPIPTTSAYVSYDVHTTWPGWLQARLSNPGYGDLNIYQSSNLPAGAFSVTAKFSFIGTALWIGAGLFFSSGTGATAQQAVRLVCEYGGGGTVCAHLDFKNTGMWTTNIGAFNGPLVGTHYLHIARNASDQWSAWYSPNGRSWAKVVLNAAKVVPVSIAAIYIALSLGGATVDTHIGCDWIRFNWLTLP